MKKIVALVLAMVMVLGLATTAMAATAAEGDSYDATTGAALGYTAEVKAAAPAVESAKMFATYQLFLTDKETKKVDVYGPMAEMALENQAAWTYVDGKVVRYFAPVTNYDMAVKAVKVEAKTDAELKCGDIKVNVDTTFYVDAKNNYYVASTVATTTDLVGNVDGKAVILAADPVDVVSMMVPHSYDYDTASVKGETVVTKVYCTACKANFKFVVGSYTDALEEFGVNGFAPAFTFGNDTVYVALPTATAGGAAEDTTVESPKTFDAGIAMYVGMSVMAAAGSAVVLKKKD